MRRLVISRYWQVVMMLQLDCVISLSPSFAVARYFPSGDKFQLTQVVSFILAARISAREPVTESNRKNLCWLSDFIENEMAPSHNCKATVCLNCS